MVVPSSWVWLITCEPFITNTTTTITTGASGEGEVKVRATVTVTSRWAGLFNSLVHGTQMRIKISVCETSLDTQMH